MAQMVKDLLLHTSRVRECMALEAMQAFLVRVRQMSLSRYAEVLYKERNMYLAEDRILCFEIVTKKHEGWM